MGTSPGAHGAGSATRPGPEGSLVPPVGQPAAAANASTDSGRATQLPAVSHREAFEGVLRSIQGAPVVVLITGHPDPDAIGSALAHQRICQDFGVPCSIAHVLPVSHRQNRAMVKLLNIDMLQVTKPEDLMQFKYLSLVDTSTPEPTLDLPADLKLLTVVDHHKMAEVDAPFVDIRPHMGASSSIYAEYMANGLAPLENAMGASRVATALLFGIQTDTDHFTLATAADFGAAAYVRRFVDSDVLKRVGRSVVSASAMGVLGRALGELLVVRDFALAGVGHVPQGDRDAIATTADFIMQREDIDTVLVYGIVEDRIDGSLRTDSPSVEPATFLHAVFGKDRAGKPYGGGRADKGGFQIPLGVLAESEDKDALWNIVTQIVRTRLAKVIPDIEREYERRQSDTHHNGHHHDEQGGRYSREF
jgi:nanoRNase/pAp phosphatase (c-di-AMP/oligoRNAs hydrolase)